METSITQRSCYTSDPLNLPGFNRRAASQTTTPSRISTFIRGVATGLFLEDNRYDREPRSGQLMLLQQVPEGHVRDAFRYRDAQRQACKLDHGRLGSGGQAVRRHHTGGLDRRLPRRGHYANTAVIT